MSDEQTNGRRGSVGNEIFDQVERLMSEEGLTRTQAFQRLSETSGRRAGTVAANYYRVARKRGAALQPRKPRAPRAPRGGATGRRGPRRAPSSNADAALARATEAIQELAAVVREQQKEMDTLREQMAQVGRLIGKI
jgi:hypothetical protein